MCSVVFPCSVRTMAIKFMEVLILAQTKKEPVSLLKHRYTCIMEYGSTPYVGMTPKKMAAALNVYEMLCSKVCFTCSHKPL